MYLYTIKDTTLIKDISVVGVIDGSGTMSENWMDLSNAWNDFIMDYKSSFCIQFDDTAELQPSAKLTKQKGEDTDIESGLRELIKLFKSGKLLKNVHVIFITDGIGEEEINIQDIAQEFAKIHADGYQIKFHTIAVGTEFSPQVISQIKGAIHNSSLLSSLMEYIQHPTIDFIAKLNQIKEEQFFSFAKLDTQVKLTPFSNSVNKLAPFQTILTTSPQIKVNNKTVNLLQEKITIENLDRFARQVLMVLMMENISGIDVRQKAQQAIQTIEQLTALISDSDPKLQNSFEETMELIENMAGGYRLEANGAVKQAELIISIQQKNVLKQGKLHRLSLPITSRGTMINTTKRIQIRDYYQELANQRINQISQQLKNNGLIEEVKEYVEVNRGRSVEQLVHQIKTHDFPFKKVKEFYQKDENLLVDLIDLSLICIL